MTQPFSELQQPDFQAALTRLLPRGRAWPRNGGSELSQLLGAHADAVYAVHARFVELLEVEADPAQANQLLADWEKDYGLPDPCTPLNPSLQQRHAALLAKIAAYGGQSPAYFINVAAALGYAITITEPSANTWVVNGALSTVTYARADQSVADDPLFTSGNTQLECVLNRLKPAHAVLVFSYT